MQNFRSSHIGFGILTYDLHLNCGSEWMRLKFSFDCVIFFLFNLFVCFVDFFSWRYIYCWWVFFYVLVLSSVWLSLECFPLILSDCLNGGSIQNVYYFMLFFFVEIFVSVCYSRIEKETPFLLLSQQLKPTHSIYSTSFIS